MYTGLPKNMEFLKNLDLESFEKDFEIWTKIIKQPGILYNFYMLSSKISVWHKNSVV